MVDLKSVDYYYYLLDENGNLWGCTDGIKFYPNRSKNIPPTRNVGKYEPQPKIIKPKYKGHEHKFLYHR